MEPKDKAAPTRAPRKRKQLPPKPVAATVGENLDERFGLGRGNQAAPGETITPQPVKLSVMDLSIFEEATKLLELGARIEDRLNVLQMAEQMASSKSSFSHGSARQRAAKLRARMMKLSRIYNAAWMVRHYQHAGARPLSDSIDKFCEVLARELEQATDREALLYAVADSLTLSPYGVPWVG